MADTRSGTPASDAMDQAGRGPWLTQAMMAHHEAMLRVARRYAGRALTAEDIVQNALVVACRHPQRLKEASSARAWLAGVTRNLARQASRKRKRREKLLRRHYPRDTSTKDFDSLFVNWQVEKILRAIETLPPGQRKTLRYMLLDGMADDEIAASLDVAEATVRSYRFKAIRKLRRILG